jgi:hypothetical protein
MEVRDYNGLGEWSADALKERYRRHCHRLGQPEARRLTAQEHVEGNVRWVYPIMHAVIDGIKAGDRACAELGVEFVESDQKQPFGRSLHASTARALKRADLDLQQVTRLRNRILQMLVDGQVPHEYRAYANLLRHIGLGPSWPEQRRKVDEGNAYVMRHVRYFERFGRLEDEV